MAPAWFVLRADLRQRWRPMLAMMLLIGLVGGVVLTAAAGAGRTDTAYPRMLRWAKASQVFIVPGEQAALEAEAEQVIVRCGRGHRERTAQ